MTAIHGRRTNDFYGGPAESWATRELLERIPSIVLGNVLEPCVGGGNIAAALGGAVHLSTNDLDKRIHADYHFDAAAAELYELTEPDWIVTNPPFSLAPILLPIFVREARAGVACLLRISYLEPTLNRRQWLIDNPPAAVWTLPRMSFTGDGKSDTVTCAWFVWTEYGFRTDVEPLAVIVPEAAGARLPE